MGQSIATKDIRSENAPLKADRININLAALQKAPCQSGFAKIEQNSKENLNPHSSVSLLSRKSGAFLSKDLSGPINSAIFFQHSNLRKLDEDYDVGEILGQGAYGQVKLVTHKKTNLIRAAKYINKKSVIQGISENKLFQEVNILMSLDHPNIVRLYHLYEQKKSYILVTEYCSGGELFQRIQSNNSFNEKTAALYMKQILSSINYLHEKGFVHRDLKAENLLFENLSEEANLKLIDFGVSTNFRPGTSEKMKETLGTVST